jgi:hypothetical protein
MRYQAFVLAALLGLCGCSKSTSAPDATSSAPGSPAADEAAQQEAQPAAPPPVVVGAGTVLAVTIDQTVSSKDNAAGDRFEASLAAPVIVDGKEAIPAGAKAMGVVTLAHSAGRFKGNATLGVTLTSVTVHGKPYDVRTSSFEEASKGRGKRTAIGAGGGAALGAIIGAIAGGGKGAAIGAGAGAGAGTAGAALTGNRDITIPAERKIDFRLRQPLEIQPD